MKLNSYYICLLSLHKKCDLMKSNILIGTQEQLLRDTKFSKSTIKKYFKIFLKEELIVKVKNEEYKVLPTLKQKIKLLQEVYKIDEV